MKRILVILALFAVAAAAGALEVPVSLSMEASQPYQLELRRAIEAAVDALEGVSLVRAGQGEWFRLHARLLEMKLDNGQFVGYALSYLILEVPFYLHASVLNALPEEAKDETLELLLRTTVFYNGSDLLTLGTDDFPWAAARIAGVVSQVVGSRIRTAEPPPSPQR